MTSGRDEPPRRCRRTIWINSTQSPSKTRSVVQVRCPPVKFRLLLVVLAVAGAVLPLPQHLIEERYSRGIYPALQSVVTPLSNRVPLPLLDIAAVVTLLGAVVLFWRSVRARAASDPVTRGARHPHSGGGDLPRVSRDVGLQLSAPAAGREARFSIRAGQA